MKSLDDFEFNLEICRQEVAELKTLLDMVTEPEERKHLMPLFKRCQHLTALARIYVPGIQIVDRVASELSLAGDFSCDLVIGDSNSKAYCLVEVEDATAKSVFERLGRKATRDWSPRFEHRFSQIVDWVYKLHDIRQTNKFERLFGRHATFSGLMLIGRRNLMEPSEAERLRWRVDRVLVDSNKVFCVTFDELYNDMQAQIRLYDRAVPKQP